MASRQTIMLLKDDAEARAIVDKIQSIDKLLDEQIDFLKKRALKLAETSNKEKQDVWKELAEHCRSRGVLPKGFSYSRDVIGFDSAMTAISVQLKNDVAGEACGACGACGQDHGEEDKEGSVTLPNGIKIEHVKEPEGEGIMLSGAMKSMPQELQSLLTRLLQKE